MMKICNGCGMVEGIPEVDEQLWDEYSRTEYAYFEPLVYTGDWMEENVQDEEDHAAVMHSMEKDMVNRHLCPVCHRPDLRGVEIPSEEDADELAEMYQQEAMERRMGC